jgi:hypothetical protein
VTLGSLEYTYCTETDVDTLLSAEAKNLWLDDNSDHAVDSTERARLTTQGINWATSRVNFYCQRRYESSDLADSWLVNDWATVVAVRWLCTRRGNSVPQSIQALYDEVIGDLEQVRDGKMQLPDIGSRSVEWMVWSNVKVDWRYPLRRVRVQRPISERSERNYRQRNDTVADHIREDY